MTQSDKKDGYLVGVISDTHGHLRPEAVAAFQGVDLIVHAGDIGKPEILESLNDIAPVHAVKGNMDGFWARALPEAEVVEIGEATLYVLHDLCRLDLDPVTAGFVAVIHGHTHTADIDNRDGVLYLNPGSAASFKTAATVVLLRIRGRSLEPQVIKLQPISQ
jgi:hypothetical protein